MAIENGVVPVAFATVELARMTWHVPARYNEQLDYIGSGSFGNVVSANDRTTRAKVAIKQVACQFSDQELIRRIIVPLGAGQETTANAVVDARELWTQRVYRELRLLRHMDHENVLGLLDVYTPQADAVNLQTVYFVTNYMDANLSTVSGLLKFNLGRVQSLMYQLLCGLKYIHSAGVIHRDLKPANIAVARDWDLRILDFGLARQVADTMTGYVSTLWYRAPEIMLSFQHYSQAADMWSAGCLMAELITGIALFPAKSDLDHLVLILDLIGTPNEQVMQQFDPDAVQFIQNQHPRPSRNFNEKFHDAGPSAVDLLTQLLAWDPEQRIPAEQALAHPYLAAYRRPERETNAPLFFDATEDENLKLTADQWRDLIFQEIQSFRAEHDHH